MTTQPVRPSQHAPSARPAALLAMSSGLDAELFTPEQRRRLGGLVTLLAESAVPDLGAVPDETAARVEILVTGWGAPRIDASVLGRMPRLRAIVHTAGTVAPFVGRAVWEREDIVVSTAAQANAVPVAEYALAQILLAGKRSVARSADHRRARGREGAWTATGRTGNYGAVAGLIGASRTGRLTAEHLQRFDIEVLVHDPFAGAEEIAALGARKVDLEELFRASDVVSLHAPDVPSTRGMITAEHFALMREGTTFLNTARPALVDEDALRAEPRTILLYEAPHKLRATLDDLAAVCGPDRPVTLCRELTKLHEEIFKTTLGEAAARYAGEEPRGEFVLVLAGAPEGAGEAEAPPTLAEAAAAARRLMEGGLPPAAAARQAAAGTPYSKGDVYRELIRAQAEDPKK